MNEIQTPSIPRFAEGAPSIVAAPQHTPHQILGPYFPAVEDPIATDDLTVVDGMASHAQGEIIVVEGRVLNRAGEAVEGARLVIWQANSFGAMPTPMTRIRRPWMKALSALPKSSRAATGHIASGL